VGRTGGEALMATKTLQDLKAEMQPEHIVTDDEKVEAATPPVEVEPVELDEFQREVVSSTGGHSPERLPEPKPRDELYRSEVGTLPVSEGWESPIITELRQAAGTAGTLHCEPSRIAGLVQEFTGSGPFRREGFLPRAAAASFMVDNRGLVWASVTDPRRPDFAGIEHSVEGRENAVTITDWIAQRARGLRDTVPAELPILIVVDSPPSHRAELKWSVLCELADHANATVAVTDWADGGGEPRFEVQP
jgi:hypothetical protein